MPISSGRCLDTVETDRPTPSDRRRSSSGVQIASRPGELSLRNLNCKCLCQQSPDFRVGEWKIFRKIFANLADRTMAMKGSMIVQSLWGLTIGPSKSGQNLGQESHIRILYKNLAQESIYRTLSQSNEFACALESAVAWRSENSESRVIGWKGALTKRQLLSSTKWLLRITRTSFSKKWLLNSN